MLGLRPDAEDLATRPIINRAPNSDPNNVPRSLVPHGAAKLVPDSEEMTQWSAYGIFNPKPFFGGYDELSEEGRGIMHVPQAGTYDTSPNPWPNNGQYDRPNVIGVTAAFLRLAPHTSAHPGYSNPTGGGPTMLFRAPPVFSIQTLPIPAVGV